MDNNEDNLFDNSKEDKNSTKYQSMKNDVEKHLDDIISIDNRYKKKMFNVVLITIIITMLICCSIFGFSIKYIQSKNIMSLKTVKENQDSKVALEAITANLKELKDFVNQRYYYADEIDYDKVMTKTLQGYVEGLGDEYSEFFSSEEYSKFNEQALGSYYGIGVYLSEKDGHTEVAATIKGSPAEEAGLKSGDIITVVNEKDTSNMSTEEIVSLIKGEEHTPVKMTVLRDGQYLTFDMETREVQVYHVESKMLDNNVGYIQLATFSEGCAEEFVKTYLELKQQGAKKFIIDLRYNTGGLVNECEAIVSAFLPINSTIYTTRMADGTQNDVKTKIAPIDTESPIVILVNEYSASASEILAAALKDNNRVQLVGTKTYGKGVIQAVFQMQDGSALKLTIAEYLTPNGTSINKIGIEPEKIVELPKENEGEFVDTQLKAAQELLK